MQVKLASIAVLGMASLALGAAATQDAASLATPAAAPTPSPSASAVPVASQAVRITAIALAPGSLGTVAHPYLSKDTPIGLSVELSNPNATPAHNLFITFTTPNGAPETRTVSVPPLNKVRVVFSDDTGLAGDSCLDRMYKVSLSGKGVDTRVRVGHMVPHCTFSASTTSGWSHTVPDRAEDARRGKAFLAQATAKVPTNCQATPQRLVVQAEVDNRSDKAGKGLRIRANGLAMSPPFDVPAKKKSALVDVENQPRSTPVGEWPLALEDPKASLGGKVADAAMTLRIDRSCTLDIKLVD